MTNKELLDKWYGKKFKYQGETHTCVGIDTEDKELEPMLIYWNAPSGRYKAVFVDRCEEVKEPRVIYVTEIDGELGLYAHKSTSAYDRSPESNIRTIKFKECVEE